MESCKAEDCIFSKRAARRDSRAAISEGEKAGGGRGAVEREEVWGVLLEGSRWIGGGGG